MGLETPVGDILVDITTTREEREPPTPSASRRREEGRDQESRHPRGLCREQLHSQTDAQ